MSEPVFFYDFASPYAYFAAHRVDDVLPVAPRWQPIMFGGLLRSVGRVPWSFKPGREPQMRECEAIAAERGLPLKWPEGWPMESYSLALTRGALVAEEAGRLKEYSRVAFRRGLGEGEDLRSVEAVASVASEAGLDGAAVAEGVGSDKVKARLRSVTDAAAAAGVVGIPTVQVGDELFWGDDRLEDAARAL